MALVLGLMFATLVAPAVAAYALRKTRAWWVVAVAVGLFGVYLLVTSGSGDHHGDNGLAVYEGAGDRVLQVYGIFMLVYAAVVFLAAQSSTRQPR